MKKLFILLLTAFLVFPLQLIHSQQNNAVWANKRVSMTFSKDSVIVEDKNNEGNIYLYHRFGNVIYLYDAIYPTDIEYYIIYKETKDSIYLLSEDNKIYKFKKKVSK